MLDNENDNPETWNQFIRGDWGQIEDDIFEGALAFGSGKKEFFNHIQATNEDNFQPRKWKPSSSSTNEYDICFKVVNH